jgi:hypothetical protein
LDILPFNIFPSGSLTSSVIPTVWIGLSVVCFFNLRLGWVLSGLVVPGYLVPLMLINPWSAGVILCEGFITYFLVWFYSGQLSRWGLSNALFGRDRFFMLVLTSIVVRLLLDGWLLPEFGEWFTRHFQISFDYRNHLHSFGLIIVALIANQFWKTGFAAGLPQFFITLGATLVIVRYGLMELTNFGLGDLSYLYEDLASSILATPKAYIVLVSTAFLASRMNLYYGWDFNGILIPSLIALQWYQPVKILATFAESGIILLLSAALLKTPWFQKTTVEGARKLLVFFNVGFVYKIALGYAALAWFPQIKTSDYFGFGYLLSTLIAVKIHDKAILARLTRATLQTSLAAVVIASIVGFSLTLLPITATVLDIQTHPESAATAMESTEQQLSSYLKQEQVELFEIKVNDSFKPPLSNEIDVFSAALGYLLNYLETKDPRMLQQAADYFNRVNYQVSRVQQRYLLIHEKKPALGWGVYVLNLATDSKLLVELPAALDEKGIIDAGISLFESLNARGFAISGSSRAARADKSSDVLLNRNSFFHVFHRLIGLHDSLQVRAYSAELARQTVGARRAETATAIQGLEPALWVKQRIPESLDLVKLEKLLDRYQIRWGEPDFDNRQRQASQYGFGELILTEKALHNLAFRPLLLTAVVDFVEQDLSIEGYIQNWILRGKEQIADKGTNLYVPPDLAQLLFFDEQVLTPLLALTREYRQTGSWAPALLEELRVIARDAAIMGYQIIRYRHRLTGQDYLVLAEHEGTHRRYWGTYVLRMGAFKPYIVQIPRPLYETNSFEFGVALFERLDAFALLIGATHPYANQDQSSDLVDPHNKVSLFSLFNQVLLREAGDREMTAISSRAYAYRPDYPYLNADAVLALDKGIVEREQLSGLNKELLDVLEADGMSVQLLDGSLQTQGYEVGSTTQSSYLNATLNKEFALLWLSPETRASYRQQDENRWQLAQFNAVGIETVEEDLADYLKRRQRKNPPQLPEEVRRLADQYVEEIDVVRLEQLSGTATERGYALARLLDLNSKQAFLIFFGRPEEVSAVLNIAPRNRNRHYLSSDAEFDAAVAKFVNQRAAWLLPEAE